MTIVHPPLDPDALIAYRTLSLTDDGRVLASKPLIARDDAEALMLAQSMTRGAGVELWDGLRFMAHFGPTSEPATIG